MPAGSAENQKPLLTWAQKESLARTAMSSANHARDQLDIDDDVPICPFTAAERLGAPVRFTDTDMEGMYVREPGPRIIVSALRPLVRRHFTCAHEMGHHVFGHGTTIDQSQERMWTYRDQDPNEFIADSFAAHFLMPVLGIRSAFFRRGVSPRTATSFHMHGVATEFRVSYASLVSHLTYALHDITPDRRKQLSKDRTKLRTALSITDTESPILVLDQHFRAPTLDVEVRDMILAPMDAVADDDVVTHVKDTAMGRLFSVSKRGAVTLSSERSNWSATVRATAEKFVGLARYRFLGSTDR